MAGRSFKKVRPFIIIIEDRSPFDSSDNDVMQRAGRVHATLPWHAYRITVLHLRVNKDTTSLFTQLSYVMATSYPDSSRRLSNIEANAK